MPRKIRDEFADLPPWQAFAVRYPDRYRARIKTAAAIKRGELVRGPCAHCGQHEGRTQAHHTDYSKPLEVQWLCGPCHKAEHDRLGDKAAPAPVESRAEYDARIAAEAAYRAERRAARYASYGAKTRKRTAQPEEGAAS